MQAPRYEVQTTPDRQQFEFVSTGPNGVIVKRIEFTFVESLAFWNLGFGDYDPMTNHIDDQAVSDNGDGRKVLATVAFALQEFLRQQPDATVFFTGSTDQRTKIYGWGLTNYWASISVNFNVEAVVESGDVIPFPTKHPIVGFLISLK